MTLVFDHNHTRSLKQGEADRGLLPIRHRGAMFPPNRQGSEVINGVLRAI